MYSQRRQYERQPGPFEGSWSASSDPHECGIAHLSPSGCFVDSATAPEPGASITVSVVFGKTRFSLPAQVVYLDRDQGFGARFLPSEQQRALAYAMGAIDIY